MIKSLQLYNLHLPLALFLVLVVSSCGSYQQASYYEDDGIYSSGNEVVRVEKKSPQAVRVENTESDIYGDYFGQKADEYGEILEDEIFTDVDSYSSNGAIDSTAVGAQSDYFDINSNTYRGNAAWGDNPSNVTINVYDNWASGAAASAGVGIIHGFGTAGATVALVGAGAGTTGVGVASVGAGTIHGAGIDLDLATPDSMEGAFTVLTMVEAFMVVEGSTIEGSRSIVPEEVIPHEPYLVQAYAVDGRIWPIALEEAPQPEVGQAFQEQPLVEVQLLREAVGPIEAIALQEGV